jgi:predicted RNA binding protein YcfA (HicA-like mRNA interferase family)
MGNRKELNSIIKAVVAQGWTVEQTKSCHYRFTAPSGNFFFTSSTPSDVRALERIKSDIRKLGLDLRTLKK